MDNITICAAPDSCSGRYGLESPILTCWVTLARFTDWMLPESAAVGLDAAGRAEVGGGFDDGAVCDCDVLFNDIIH